MTQGFFGPEISRGNAQGAWGQRPLLRKTLSASLPERVPHTDAIPTHHRRHTDVPPNARKEGFS